MESLTIKVEQDQIEPLKIEPEPFNGAMQTKPIIGSPINTEYCIKSDDFDTFKEPTSLTSFKCDTCDKLCGTLAAYKSHVRVHKNQKICKHCKKSFNGNYNLKVHIQTIHLKSKPYKCEYCDYATGVKSTLKSHLRQHTGDTPYKCQYCEKAFHNSSNYKEHLRQHTGEQPYECKDCGEKFALGKRLKAHAKTHITNPILTCTKCGKKFRKRGSFIRHDESNVCIRKDHVCEYCNKPFSKLGYLTEHLRIHTGDEPYKCEICNKTFKHGYALKVHRYNHTGEKPYECKFCSERFRSTSCMKRHIRSIHTGERPYGCTICGKRYLMGATVRKHMETHKMVA